MLLCARIIAALQVCPELKNQVNYTPRIALSRLVLQSIGPSPSLTQFLIAETHRCGHRKSKTIGHSPRNPSGPIVGVSSTTSFGKHSESYERDPSFTPKTRTCHSARRSARQVTRSVPAQGQPHRNARLVGAAARLVGAAAQ